MAPPVPAVSRQSEMFSAPAPREPDAQQTRRPQRNRPLMRRYEVAWLSDEGMIEEFHRLAPATPCFESAFAAFGRGALIQTETGPRAIEDLLPGDMVVGEQFGLQPLRWIGQMTLVAGLPGQVEGQSQLTRISADSFGLSRPMPDLLLGPAARLEHRVPDGLTRLGSDRAYVPVGTFSDGHSVIDVTPVAPVQVFHLCLDRHDSVVANGLAIEAFHPGRVSDLRLSDDLFALYLSLFPHVTRVADFGDLALPRITGADMRRVA